MRGERHEGGGRADRVVRPVLGERVEDDPALEPVHQHQRSPLTSEAPSWHTIPVMWNSGAIAKYTGASGSPSPVRWRSALYRMLAWVLVAPFGAPLVPEV